MSTTLDYIKEEIESALENVNSYGTETPRVGRPASEEFWEDTKASVSDLLQEEPDSLFYLVKVAVDRLRGLIQRSRTTLGELQDLSPVLRVIARPYSTSELIQIRQHLTAMSRVVSSEAGRQRRLRGLRNTIRESVKSREGSTAVGGAPIKNKEEALVDSRALMTTLSDLHEKLSIIPPGILSVKSDHEDRETHAEAIKRRLATAEDGLRGMEVSLLSGRKAASRLERNTTMGLIAISALVKARTQYVDPEDLKFEGSIVPKDPCAPAAADLSKQPPFIIDPTDNVVDLMVEASNYAWNLPSATPARVQTRAITTDHPYLANPDLSAQLVSDDLSSGIPMFRRTLSSTNVVITPLNTENPGDPAMMQAVSPIFGASITRVGDIVRITDFSSAIHYCRILAVADPLTAVVELPAAWVPTIGLPVPLLALDLIRGNQMGVEMDGELRTVEISYATIELYSGSSFNVPGPDAVTDFNSFFTPNPFSYNGTDDTIEMDTQKAGPDGVVAVTEAALVVDKDVLTPLQDVVKLSDRESPTIEVVLTGVSGTFEVGETVSFTGGASSTVRQFMSTSNVLTIDTPTNPALVSGTASGAASLATGTVDNWMYPTRMTSADDNNNLKLEFMKVDGTLDSVDDTIPSGTRQARYEDAVTLAAVIDALLPSSELVAFDEDDRVVIESARLGHGSLIQTVDCSASLPLSLLPDVFRGTGIETDELKASVGASQVPAELTSIRTILAEGLAVIPSPLGLYFLPGHLPPVPEVGDIVQIKSPALNYVEHSDPGGPGYQVGQKVTSSSGGTGVVEFAYRDTTSYILLKDMQGPWGIGDTLDTVPAGLPSTVSLVGVGSSAVEGLYHVDAVSDPSNVTLELDRQLVDQGVYWVDIAREELTLSSLDETTTSSLLVEAGTSQAILGLPTDEVRGTTKSIELEDVDLSRKVRPKIRRGDLISGLSVGDMEIAAVRTSDNELSLPTAIPNNEDNQVQVQALGKPYLETLQAGLDDAWDRFLKSDYVSNLDSIDKLLEQAAQQPRWIHEYQQRLDEYDSLLESLDNAIIDFRANRVPAMQSALDGLEENRLDAAREVLTSCRIKEFLSLTLEEASYWNLAVKALGRFFGTIELPEGDDLEGYDEPSTRSTAFPPTEDMSDSREQDTDIFQGDGDIEEGVYG